MKQVLLNYSFNAIKMLGIKNYIVMIIHTLASITKILKTKRLFIVDKKMGRLGSIDIQHPFGKVKVDVAQIDREIQETPFAFSSVRELYIKNCYFKKHQLNQREIKML